jgi:hypothetical protein
VFATKFLMLKTTQEKLWLLQKQVQKAL